VNGTCTTGAGGFGGRRGGGTGGSPSPTGSASG
jgi:hypothetical protein